MQSLSVCAGAKTATDDDAGSGDAEEAAMRPNTCPESELNTRVDQTTPPKHYQARRAKREEGDEGRGMLGAGTLRRLQ